MIDQKDKHIIAINKKVNDMVNSLETITFYKHHYVRKTGLKKKVKQLTYNAIDDYEKNIKEKLGYEK